MDEELFQKIDISQNDVRFELTKQLVRSLNFDELIIFLSTVLAQNVAIKYSPSEFAQESVQSRSRVVMPLSKKIIDTLRNLVSLRIDDHKAKNALMSYILINVLTAGIMSIIEQSNYDKDSEWYRVYREISQRLENMIKQDEHGPDLASEKD